MGEIVPFAPAAAAPADDSEPSWAGPCVCLGCRHEWVGVGPIGYHANLTCPECALPKGTIKYPFGADAGDEVLTCAHCEGEALTAYRHKGYKYVRCMSCGTDLTKSFYV